MYVRDLCAACVAFIAACALFAVQRYLVEPTVVVAPLFVTSAVAFLVALVAYAATVASRKTAPPATNDAPLPRAAVVIGERER